MPWIYNSKGEARNVDNHLLPSMLAKGWTLKKPSFVETAPSLREELTETPLVKSGSKVGAPQPSNPFRDFLLGNILFGPGIGTIFAAGGQVSQILGEDEGVITDTRRPKGLADEKFRDTTDPTSLTGAISADRAMLGSAARGGTGAGTTEVGDFAFDPDPDGDGGGGGGGRQAPVYTPPDRRAVFDMVSALSTALVGDANEAEVNRVTDVYMAQHRKAWEGHPNQPDQEALEAIRATDRYKRIHKNRPDFIKEGEWIGRQINQLQAQGVRQGDVQTRATQLATAGVSPSDRTARTSQIAAGQQTPQFVQTLKRQAGAVARMIR